MSSHPSEISIGRLIFWPFLISLAVTILRLVGELQHWPTALFNPTAGGAGSIIGISWLPPIFGVYFAIKLSRSGAPSPGLVKSLGASIIGLLALFGGFFALGQLFKSQSLPMLLLAIVCFALSALIPLAGWRALAKTLLAYAFASRIVVLIVMYFAIQGAWGTHYDVVGPNLPAEPDVMKKFAQIALFPQMTLWIGLTVVPGSIFGSIAGSLTHKRRQPAGELDHA